MTVVVTGAAGFIGAHLVRALARRGHSVAGIDRRGGVPTAAATAIQADVADPDDDLVSDLLAGAEAVFHLAAFPGVREHGAAADARRRRDNIDAAERVAGTVPLDVPLVVTSSSSVYGGSSGRACAENDTPAPRGAYAESKLEVERICARRVSHGGLVAVARPFTVAGEGQRPDMAISRWMAAVNAGQPLHIFGGPQRTRDITDVTDVVEGLLRMAERGVRATVNLGTGRGHRLDAIAAAVSAALGAPLRTVVEPAESVEPSDTLADTTRCEALLGFVPRTDLEQLVRRQVAAAVAAPLEPVG